jgi:iron(III) transport system permease protein
LNSLLRLAVIASVALFAAPLVALIIEGLQSFISDSTQISSSLLLRYGLGSLWVVLGSVTGAILFGVVSAYLCARFNFAGRTLILWGSILPLGVPSYLVAYSWLDFLVDAGFAGGGLRTLPFTCLIFAVCLAPYVFLPAYTALSALPASYVETAKLLGHSRIKTFFRVEMPLTLASVSAGALLAGMEVLSDFGTVDFMAIDTWSTGVYRHWFGYGDRGKAALLALFLLTVSVSLMYWESLFIAKKSALFNTRSVKGLDRKPLRALPAMPFAAFAFFPALFGCVLPLLILANRTASNSSANTLEMTFMKPLSTTLAVAAAAGMIVTLTAIMFASLARYEKNPFIRFFSRLGSIGYALPGGVIGLGLLILLAPFSLSGSLLGLLFAYCIRFNTIGTSTIGAGWRAIPKELEAQAQLLGCTPRKVFTRVSLPLLRKSLACAFILTSIDVIKELPATMLLRPFNFETLAIRTYTLASDERLAETAPSAFAMIVLCLAGILLAGRFGAFGLNQESAQGNRHDN